MKYEIRVKKGHPARKYRVGSHVAFQDFKVFDLNEKEEKELLNNPGCNRWLEYKKAEVKKSEQKEKVEKEKKAKKAKVEK